MYLSKDEEVWRRKDDARTLANAEAIKADKKRLREAQIGAREILEEEKERNKGLERVARSSSRHSNKATVATNIFCNYTK